MISSELENKWNSIIDIDLLNGYRSLRISSKCIAEIYLAISSLGDHCLILSLPKDHNVDFNSIKKEKISIELFHKTGFLILTLQDNNYYDLFDDLIVSLYNSIKDIPDVNLYSKVFIRSFYKWSEFFEEIKNDRLTKENIKGLFGELLVLKDLLKNTNSSNVDNILDSWKGPYDLGHDFILDDKNVEVKTKNLSRQSITISSEYQLEILLEKRLELLVVSVVEDPVNGVSIKELINEIRLSVIDMLGDLSIFLKAISQKGLTLKNIHEYDNFRFTPINQLVYNCQDDSFPKLVKSNLHESLSKLKYDISLSNLDEYLLSIVEF